MSTLHEDAEEKTPDFQGATLNMDDANLPEVDFKQPNISRDRPFSASTMSRKTVASTTSRASRSPSVNQTKYSVKSFFSYRPGSFDKAVADITEQLVKKEADGEVQGAWLLTEIDHWDFEHEKVVVLTDFSLIIVRYDFVTLKVYRFFKIMLQCIHTAQIGNLVYPPKSLMASRECGGIRVSYGNEEVGFFQKWNPWRKLPYFIFTHHPLVYFKDESETVTYNVDDFFDTLVTVVRDARKSTPGSVSGQGTMQYVPQGVSADVVSVKGAEGDLQVLEEDIVIESYASLTSMIHNQSSLGFSKERGGVSY